MFVMMMSVVVNMAVVVGVVVGFGVGVVGSDGDAP
jgi:hypothetical protein